MATSKLFAKVGSKVTSSFSALKRPLSKVKASKLVTGSAKVATAGGLIGLGSIPVAMTGRNIREAFGKQTEEEVARKQLDNVAYNLDLQSDQLDLMKDYSQYLKDNNLADGDGSYGAYVADNPRGFGIPLPQAEEGNNGNPLVAPAVVLGIAALGGVGLWQYMKKRKRK